MMRTTNSKTQDVAERLMKAPHEGDYGYFEFFDLPSYGPTELPNLRRDLQEAAFAGIPFLAQLDLHAFNDAEIPAVYAMYDNQMALLKCVTLKEFLNRIVVTRFPKQSFSPSNRSIFIIKKDYDAILSLGRNLSHDAPMGEHVIDVLSRCHSNDTIFGFYFKLLAYSARMAALTVETNEYNSYRVYNDIHALFFGGDIALGACDCFAYVYATGQVIDMVKKVELYLEAFKKGNLTPIGITQETPPHLWSKEYLQALVSYEAAAPTNTVGLGSFGLGSDDKDLIAQTIMSLGKLITN